MRKLLRSIRHGLRNLSYYLPVIWKDRDYDHYFIETLLLQKYKKAYKLMNGSNRFVNSHKYNQALRICINILERRVNDWYTDLWWNNGRKETMIYHKTEERDWKLFCRILQKYHDHWWD